MEDTFWGTYQGAIESMINKRLDRCVKLVWGFYLDELRVLDKEVTVETENSPLKKALNCTATLQLEHNENTFSFTATAIRYTEKQDIAYSWKLDHTDWSAPSVDNRIRFSNLPPGEYIFSVRALSLITVGRCAKKYAHHHSSTPLEDRWSFPLLRSFGTYVGLSGRTFMVRMARQKPFKRTSTVVCEYDT